MSFPLCVDISSLLLGHHLVRLDQDIAATGIQLPPVLQNQVAEKLSPLSREMP